jgi:putative ABC transport system ATP-binding protein
MDALPAAGSLYEIRLKGKNAGETMRLKDVHKSYREGSQVRHILEGAHAEFEPGEVVAVQGRSGSGKTTLLNVISGVDRADSGEIWLNGADIISMSVRDRTLFRRRNIGIIFQFFNLISTLTAWENILLPLELEGRPEAESTARGRALIKEVGLWERKDAFPDRLSGGEQQRVAIARALIHDPVLLLADEPTGNLDEDTGAGVLALLDRLTRRAGKNMILVTHSKEVSRFADRILYLRGGRLHDHLPSGEIKS